MLVPLSYREGPLPEPTASLSQDQDLSDGQTIGLVGRALTPNRTYDLRLCQASPGDTCDDLGPWQTATADEDGMLRADIQVHAAIYGWQGRVDCTLQACAVVISDPSTRRAEAVIEFAAGVEAPVPRLELDPAGPYVDRQEVTLRGSGFRPGHNLDGQIGQCAAHLDTAKEERCGYTSLPVVAQADGTFTTPITVFESLALTGSCVGEPGCVIAWIIPHGPIGASAPLQLRS